MSRVLLSRSRPPVSARRRTTTAPLLALQLLLLVIIITSTTTMHPARALTVLRRPFRPPAPASLASLARVRQQQSPQSQPQRRGFRAAPTCGLKVDIHIRGKRTGGEEWLNEAYTEYVKRLRPVLALETVWHKTDEELEAAVAKEKAPVICLDERGKELSSLEVADRLYKKLEEGGSRLAFVIGGAEGLPPSIKAARQRYEFWSLSRLTFTHQWARVLLTEQLYRATEIRKGSGYHKE